MSILPVVQAINRVHYQASKWYQTIHYVPFEGNGWIWCEDDAFVKPVWFTGEQLAAVEMFFETTKWGWVVIIR